MKFVQIMEITTDRFEDMEKLHEKWLSATEGQRTVEMEWIMRDRDADNRYVIAVMFDSYDDAMKNNDLPATADIAAGIAALTTTPTTFRNLDVVRIDQR
jgi:hypothetical protein